MVKISNWMQEELKETERLWAETIPEDERDLDSQMRLNEGEDYYKSIM